MSSSNIDIPSSDSSSLLNAPPSFPLSTTVQPFVGVDGSGDTGVPIPTKGESQDLTNSKLFQDAISFHDDMSADPPLDANASNSADRLSDVNAKQIENTDLPNVLDSINMIPSSSDVQNDSSCLHARAGASEPNPSPLAGSQQTFADVSSSSPMPTPPLTNMQSLSSSPIGGSPTAVPNLSCGQCLQMHQQQSAQQQRARALARQLQEEEARAREREAVLHKLRTQLASQTQQAAEDLESAVELRTAAVRTECERLRGLLESTSTALATARHEAAVEIEQAHGMLERARREASEAEGRSAQGLQSLAMEHHNSLRILQAKLDDTIALQQREHAIMERERAEAAAERERLQAQVRELETREASARRELEEARQMHVQAVETMKEEARQRKAEAVSGQQSVEALALSLAEKDAELSAMMERGKLEREASLASVTALHNVEMEALRQMLQTAEEGEKAAKKKVHELEQELEHVREALCVAEETAAKRLEINQTYELEREKEQKEWLASEARLQNGKLRGERETDRKRKRERESKKERGRN